MVSWEWSGGEESVTISQFEVTMWPWPYLHLPSKTSFSNYPSYYNNHSKSFPICRYIPHSFQTIPCNPTPKKTSLDKKYTKQLPSYIESIFNFQNHWTHSLILSKRHLSSNSLYNPNQSVYTKYHSTETTLLSLHNHLITAISNQQVPCLCLLDLSTAFDTINHSILLHLLSSWFGIIDTAFTLFRTYYHLALSLSLLLVLHHLPVSFSMAYPRTLSLTLSFSTCIQHLSALSSHPAH